MTSEEFERGYAEWSGVTVEQLRAMGRIVRPCVCGEDSCPGWQSINRKSAEENDQLMPGWDGDRRWLPPETEP